MAACSSYFGITSTNSPCVGSKRVGSVGNLDLYRCWKEHKILTLPSLLFLIYSFSLNFCFHLIIHYFWTLWVHCVANRLSDMSRTLLGQLAAHEYQPSLDKKENFLQPLDNKVSWIQVWRKWIPELFNLLVACIHLLDQTRMQLNLNS